MDKGFDSIEEERRVSELLDEVNKAAGLVCFDCNSVICGHEYVINVVMGTKDTPRCLKCLSSSLGRDNEKFLAQTMEHIVSRICYRTAWHWASKNEGFGDKSLPECLFPDKNERTSAGKEDSISGLAESAEPVPDLEWDAGELSCGDLVLQLRGRLMPLKPGTVLAVTTEDPGARQDIPAWCKLTGHTLVSSAHPVYLIRRKID